MNSVDEYIANLEPSDKAVFELACSQVKYWVPDVTQGVSYGMPAFKYKDKALLSLMVCKKHYGGYPYSGKVIEKLKDRLTAFVTTTGSVHFPKGVPIPDSLLKEIVQTRIDEINGV